MSSAPLLERRDVVARLLADRGALLVVTGLGAPAWDCTAAGDHPLTFPLWGGMGARRWWASASQLRSPIGACSSSPATERC